MARFLFVGERRSTLAIKRDVTWEDGGLAAAPLFEALRAIGLEPSQQRFVNLFFDPPRRPDVIPQVRQLLTPYIFRSHPELTRDLPTVVGMGQVVSFRLAQMGVPHIPIVHPAARGRIRKRERYIAHVVERLDGGLWTIEHVTRGRGASLIIPRMLPPAPP